MLLFHTNSRKSNTLSKINRDLKCEDKGQFKSFAHRGENRVDAFGSIQISLVSVGLPRKKEGLIENSNGNG